MQNFALIAIASLAGVATAQAPTPRIATLVNAHGDAIGQVALTDAPRGVLLRVEANGLTPGWHAIHFHEKADCTDAAFKTAGAHVHPTTPSVHGLLNPAASDLGDLPNIYADSEGKANAELFTTLVALRGGTSRTDLIDADGSALVIHAKADDHMTQPIGGAGERVACAALR